MLTGTAKVSLDFYAPPMDCRQLAKEKLDRTRTDMYTSSYASSLKVEPQAQKKIFNPLPKEVFIENTQRAAEHARRVEAEESGAARWPQAGVIPRNRCRLWQENGFHFDTAYFQTAHLATRMPHRAVAPDPLRQRQLSVSGRPPSLAHRKRRDAPNAGAPPPPSFFASSASPSAVGAGTKGGRDPFALAASTSTPYQPYFHDVLTLCRASPGPPLALGITARRAEAGPLTVRRPHDVGLATGLFKDLTQRWGETEGENENENKNEKENEKGNEKGKRDGGGVVTGEIAYALRPAFCSTHPERLAQSVGRGAAGESAEAVPMGSLYAAAAATDGGEGAAKAAGSSTACAARQRRELPTEAKALRVYTIRMKGGVLDIDTRMVQRQEPPRKGVPVLLSEFQRSA